MMLSWLKRKGRQIIRRGGFIAIGFILFLTFMLKDVIIPNNLNTDDDSCIGLKSQNGYLRHKIAKLKSQLSTSSDEDGSFVMDDMGLPTIYVITPTYARPTQKAELTRLCHVFLMVPNLHWILVEDSKSQTKLVTNFLRHCGVSYTHLNVPTPPDWKLQNKEKRWRKPRGVLQRNEALIWLRENSDRARSNGGVIYFADDDNTYSIELFDEMRHTKTVSVWPVGLVGGLMVEGPIADQQTKKVIGWNAVWGPKRPYPIDMAGFAINLDMFLNNPKVKFALEVKVGGQESELLKHFNLSLNDLEPKANLCREVLVWHTRTEKADLHYEKVLKSKNRPPSDLHIEV